MSELDDLKKRVAELEKAVDPPPRSPSTHQAYDYTQGFSMPASAMRALIDAVPDRLMSDLRADARKPNPVTSSSSMIPTANEASETKRGSGWQEATPLGPPEGVKLVDQIAEGFAARERRGG